MNGFLCHLYRVEDRNDLKMQKMRRYVEAFSKEDEKEKEGLEKTDTTKEYLGSLTGWEMIRHSLLGLDMEQK